MHTSLSSRLIGFFGSLLLTLATFLIVLYPEFFHLKSRSAVIVILNLAILQSIVQVIFFLNLLSEKGPRWNLVVFFSTVSIIFIIIVFSIWIMDQLNYNMLPYHVPLT